ncbi:MAG TPA: J domain-containing protein, partial [Rhodospirillales bacterium]|nr:J domain-containing protein [Rhodospirillales bacterium]
MTDPVIKHSYTIPCATDFRDAVTALAKRAGANAADLARSVVLMIPKEEIDAFPDPGPPKPRDRETIILKSGTAKGKPWRRKPRLQVRMAPGFDIETIRKALGLALAMDRGERTVRLDDASAAVKKSEAETELIREEMAR